MSKQIRKGSGLAYSYGRLIFCAWMCSEPWSIATISSKRLIKTLLKLFKNNMNLF